MSFQVSLFGNQADFETLQLAYAFSQLNRNILRKISFNGPRTTIAWYPMSLEELLDEKEKLTEHTNFSSPSYWVIIDCVDGNRVIKSVMTENDFQSFSDNYSYRRNSTS